MSPDTRTTLHIRCGSDIHDTLRAVLVLEIIAETGPIKGRDVFCTLMEEREPLPYLGDSMFWYVLDDLQNAWQPPLQPYPADDGSEWADRTPLGNFFSILLAVVIENPMNSPG